MPITTADLFYGTLIPVVVAGLSAITARRLLPTDMAQRYPATLATLIGFITGYMLLGFAPMLPTSHWHWMPHTLLAASLLGPVLDAGGIARVERACMYLLVSFLAGWLLVPSWADLRPTRTVLILTVTLYTSCLAYVLDPLARKVVGPVLPCAYCATMATTSVLAALSGSMKFAQIGMAATGALLGLTLAAFYMPKVAWAVGLSLPFSLCLIALLLIARVHSFSSIPLTAYVVVPCAPATLRLLEHTRLRHLNQAQKFGIAGLLTMIPLCVALTIAGITELGSLSPDS